MNYGYIRVSAKDQNEDRQVMALKEAGISGENMFIDKCSGRDFERPEFQRLVHKLTRGDVLHIKSIDRLGRNYDEIITWWGKITKTKEADIVVLDMPLLDTRSKRDDLTGKFISDLVLQILSYVAETERANIKQRQREGIEAARLRNVRFGRPEKPLPIGFDNVFWRWRRSEISSQEASVILKMPETTFRRKAQKYSAEVE